MMKKKITSTPARIGALVLLHALLACSWGAGKDANEKSIDLSSPKGATLAFADALISGDTERTLALIVRGERADRIVRGMADSAAAQWELERAAQEKFGTNHPASWNPDTMRQAYISRIQRAKFVEKGATATPEVEGGGQMIYPLKKIGAQWRVDVAAGLQPEGDAERSAYMQKMATAFRNVAKGIRAGQYPNADEASTAIEKFLRAS